MAIEAIDAEGFSPDGLFCHQHMSISALQMRYFSGATACIEMLCV